MGKKQKRQLARAQSEIARLQRRAQNQYELRVETVETMSRAVEEITRKHKVDLEQARRISQVGAVFSYRSFKAAIETLPLTSRRPYMPHGSVVLPMMDRAEMSPYSPPDGSIKPNDRIFKKMEARPVAVMLPHLQGSAARVWGWQLPPVIVVDMEARDTPPQPNLVEKTTRGW